MSVKTVTIDITKLCGDIVNDMTTKERMTPFLLSYIQTHGDDGIWTIRFVRRLWLD